MAQEGGDISRPQRRRWYKGLYRGDCKMLEDLMTECRNPKLVLQGWKEDPDMKGFKDKVPRGRTALHVAAMRGYPKLVGMVLEAVSRRPPSSFEVSQEDSAAGELEWKNLLEQREPREDGSYESSIEDSDEEDSAHGAEPDLDSDLRELLLAKDPQGQMDALNMAVNNGNWEVMYILSNASFSCEGNPYEINTDHLRKIRDQIKGEKERSANESAVQQIQAITQKFMDGLGRDAGAAKLKARYDVDVNLNFLPWQSYLFFFTFQTRNAFGGIFKYVIKFREEVFRASDMRVQNSLLQLKDGRGRTALHAAIETGTTFLFRFLLDFCIAAGHKTVMNDLRDRVGRTSLHWAAALGDVASVRHLLSHGDTDPNVQFDLLDYRDKVPVRNLSQYAFIEFFGVSALHLAILFEQEGCVQTLLYSPKTDPRRINFSCTDTPAQVGEALLLATIVGNVQIVRLLLENKRVQDAPDVVDGGGMQFSLHIAATCGNFELVRALLDHGTHNPFSKDVNGNTTLHHVMLGVSPQHRLHELRRLVINFLLDYVRLDGCQGDLEFKEYKLEPQEVAKRLELGYIERQGCVELLLQAGFDPWQHNARKEAPYPAREAPQHFLSWWYEKLSKETIVAQNTLNAAANAISVTAALVATASFGGPLQPPLGILGSENRMQVDILSIRVFVVCDTLSLYFAVAAIMMALIPSLPLPHQSSRLELKRTRRIVNIAVGLLFPSIIFVLIAFAAAYISVNPNDGSRYGGVTDTTIAIGGSLSCVVIVLFSIRVLTILDTSPEFRKFYDRMGF